jgi:mRNA-degrading endonuclease RelE of RelBE toxin-antitoxin system
MVIHMKTTVQISDTLMEEARKVARSERSTVRALIEEGLQRVLKERRHKTRFKLRKATFKGKGLQSGVAGAPWERIRELTYEGRGG